MGRKFKDEVQKDIKSPFGIVEAENGDAWVEVDEIKWPPQVSAEILKKMKTAEEYLGKVEGRCYSASLFNDSQSN